MEEVKAKLRKEDETEEQKYVTYRLKTTESSELARLASRQSELGKYNVLYEEKVAIPSEFPPLSVQSDWRRVNFNKVGTTKGNNFIIKTLKERVKMGLDNIVSLDAFIKVVDSSGRVLRYLTPQVLTPSSNDLDVMHSENKIIVRLKNPPKISHLVHLKEQPLNNDPSLETYANYKMEYGYPFSPHR